MSWNDEKLIEVLQEGGVAVMPTDTLYGIVGRAEDREAVERIYKIRKRNPQKPCIILISGINGLQKFEITPTPEQKREIEKYWSFDSAQDKNDAVSIIFDCPDEKFVYLHRGTKTLAFRIPAQPELQSLLKETGPLIAPSTNPEGLEPAHTTEEAKKYFGNEVDLYVDGGELTGKASKVLRLHKDGSVIILRA